MSEQGRSAFVTGATGFLGLNLVRELIEQGWRVYALHRRNSDLQYLRDLPLALVEGDILDPQSLAEAMPEKVDVVFHVAGDTSMWSKNDAMQTGINVEGTRNVIQAALDKRVGRLVHTSTLSAFGRHKNVVDESTPSNAQDSFINYERSKYEGERLVLKAVARDGLDAVVVSPGAIMGPYDSTTWAEVFFMLRDGKMPALPPGSISFNHVHEVVKAHIRAAEVGRCGELYLLGGDKVVLAKFMQAIAKRIGAKVPWMVAPAPVLKFYAALLSAVAAMAGKEPDITPEMAAFMAANSICDSSKAEQELDYQMVPIEDCIRDAHEWLQTEGLVA